MILFFICYALKLYFWNMLSWTICNENDWSSHNLSLASKMVVSASFWNRPTKHFLIANKSKWHFLDQFKRGVDCPKRNSFINYLVNDRCLMWFWLSRKKLCDSDCQEKKKEERKIYVSFCANGLPWTSSPTWLNSLVLKIWAPINLFFFF